MTGYQMAVEQAQEQLLKNDARYRFLRGGEYYADTEASFKDKDGELLMGDELDAAIDKAMSVTPNSGPDSPIR